LFFYVVDVGGYGGCDVCGGGDVGCGRDEWCCYG
jgi:hypothetical protein